MGDGVLVGASGVSVNATGVIVDASGTPCCCGGCIPFTIGSPLTCSGSMPSSVTITLPTTGWDPSPCNTTSACGSPISSLTLNLGTCSYGESPTARCIGGYQAGSIFFQAIQILNTEGLASGPNAGCCVYQLRITFQTNTSATGAILYYEILRTSTSTPDVLGSYPFIAAQISPSNTTPCSPTCPSTLTVS